MDRQDIDALLIGALYGELTPADEARLATHLDTHPGDRGALDDLKFVRQAVLDSRILAVQLEPPQALSAVLLQEAHRRAPKRVVARDENEGWFARFAKSFMAHPAMAAAAMLVLVLGGAGIMYMKNGQDQFAAQEAAQPSATRVSDTVDRLELAAQNAPAVATPSAAAGSSAGSAFGAGLYDRAEDSEDSKMAFEGDGRAVESERRKAAEVAQESQTRARGDKAKISGGVEVTTERAPKDLDEQKNELAKDDFAGVEQKPAVKKAATKGGGGGGTATGTATTTSPDTSLAIGRDANTNAISGAGPSTGYAQPPPPQATGTKVATTTAKMPTAKPTAPATPSPEPAPAITAAPKADPAPAKEAQDKSLVAWATSEHNRAISLAKAGKCADAAKVVLSVSNRANSYYAQNMATDRRLKSCAQYINAERDREAEKSQKARAQKRVNADEAAAPTNVK
jgi:hypothetical protein